MLHELYFAQIHQEYIIFDFTILFISIKVNAINLLKLFHFTVICIFNNIIIFLKY